LAPALVATALGIGNAIMLEAGLSFLGLGVQPPTPSWGNLIAAGRDALVVAPWVALAPALLVALVVLASSLLAGPSWSPRSLVVSVRRQVRGTLRRNLRAVEARRAELLLRAGAGE
jgi:hypothetical protein